MNPDLALALTLIRQHPRECVCDACQAARAEAKPPRRELSDEELLGAIARGWCSPENSGKEMDTTLVTAISNEVRAVLRAAEPQHAQAPEQTVCTYPACSCPFDAPSDQNWCARGLQRAVGGEG